MEEPVKPVKKIRKCLNCNKDFKSKGAANRICLDCRQKIRHKNEIDLVPLPDLSK